MHLATDETNQIGESLKVGLFPGSFNPPHAGHIELAARSKSEVGLDHILFYVNSFNLAKREQLESLAHRKAMLALLIDPSCMSIVPEEFYPDVPEDAWRSGSYSFVPLVERLQMHRPRNELWMLRGADYFAQSDGNPEAYPRELWHLPHIVGTRGQDARDLRLEMLSRSVCVDTRAVSSSDVRGRFAGERVAPSVLDDRLAAYVDQHSLYRQTMSSKAGLCEA